MNKTDLNYINKLKNTQETLRNVIDTAPITISWITSDLTYLGINKQLETIIGMTSEKIIGQKVGFQGKRDEFHNFIASIFKNDSELCKTEFSVDTANNKKKYFYTVAKKYNNNREAVVIGIDITDLKDAEIIIKENEYKHRTFIEKLPDLVLKLDSNGLITFTNEAINLLGYSQNDIIGHHFKKIIHPDDIERVSRNYLLPKLIKKKKGSKIAPKLFDERRTGKRKTINLEIRLIHKDWKKSDNKYAFGKKRIERHTIYADVTSYGEYNTYVENKEKRLIGSITIVRDITSRVIAERKLKETTNKLIQKEKMISLGDMTSGIAHEINQPLSTIKIVCQDILRDIQKKRFSEEYLESDIKTVDSAINKMSGIINHMKLFSQKPDITNKMEIDINNAINGVLILTEEQLKVQNIKIKKELAGNLPMLTANQIMLEHAFMNLINNARDALKTSDKSEKIIKIKTCSKQTSKDKPLKIIVEIKDNGVGIKKEIQDRIFEPFYTTKEPGCGTGLGLSTANRIISDFGGWIEIKSMKNVGSTFTVTLPATN